MSLTSFVKGPDVRAMLKPLRPDIPRKIEAPLLAPPRSGRTQIIGIGFDYLFRFEVQRRYSAARHQHWVADNAPLMLRGADIPGGELQIIEPGSPPMLSRPPGGFARIARKVDRLLDEIHDAVDAHVSARNPDPVAMRSIAAHAMRLARLDLVYRARVLDLGFANAELDDVEDLLAMIEVVPWNAFATEGRILLNPTFGQASAIVGGADADLIWGDLLVDLKSTKDEKIKPEYFDQLLGYFLLARRNRRKQRSFPQVKRVGLYFARRAHLLTFPVETWTAHPTFKTIERDFFALAESEL